MSAEYMFFNLEGSFDDGDGNEVSLDEHLNYLENYCGTPDMMDSFHTDSSGDKADQEAMTEAKTFNIPLAVVSDDFRYIGETSAQF